MMQIALDCWRALGRAEDIGAATQILTERLATHLPLAVLGVRGLHLEDGRLTSEALGVWDRNEDVRFVTLPLR